MQSFIPPSDGQNETSFTLIGQLFGRLPASVASAYVDFDCKFGSSPASPRIGASFIAVRVALTVAVCRPPKRRLCAHHAIAALSEPLRSGADSNASQSCDLTTGAHVKHVSGRRTK